MVMKLKIHHIYILPKTANTLVAACGELKGIDYYEAVWRNAGSV